MRRTTEPIERLADHPPVRRRRTILGAAALAVLSAGSTLLTAAPAAAIANGRADGGAPTDNAVVRVVDGPTRTLCTGTLVAPDLVLTAGHCISEVARGSDDPPHAPVQRLDRCPDNWQRNGRWYPLTRTISVEVGRVRTGVTSFVASSYAMTPCADAILLRLPAPVPRDRAVPIPVLASLGDGPGTTDADRLAGARFEMVGWGRTASGSAETRQRATGTYARRDAEKIYAAVDAPASMQLGDSGSPLLWTSPSGVRYVVAVMQGIGTTPRYTPTFRGPIGPMPALASLFSIAAPEALYCPDAHLRPNPARTVPLASWWSRSGTDNAALTHRSFAGCSSALRGPGYGFNRTEGYVFRPTGTAPAGTVPIYSWFRRPQGSSGALVHGDNLLTTSHAAIAADGGSIGAYRAVRLEGYVYDPSRPQPPGTVPLYRWFSPSRQDHYTSTAHPDQGAARAGLGPDYRFSRLEGYVLAG